MGHNRLKTGPTQEGEKKDFPERTNKVKFTYLFNAIYSMLSVISWIGKKLIGKLNYVVLLLFVFQFTVLSKTAKKKY